MVTTRRILWAAAVSLCLGVGAVSLVYGFSDNYLVRLMQGITIAVGGGIAIFAPAVWLMLRIAGWKDPESERDFEAVVERSERLARDGLAVEPDETDFLEPDPHDDDGFEELVRDALDDLPDWARKALDHVAVTISDGGAKRRAYGLYHGDTIARGNMTETIVIYRDTLRRDFGHDPDALRGQVTRTVRHELAHHLGFDELGVRGLGL
jgi:predicted Zn-dependent protease with MMP-like domain